MIKADAQSRQIIRMARIRGSITRSEVAEALGLSMPTVKGVISELIVQGILVPMGHEQSAGGRPAALFTLNPDYMYAVGVECSLLGIEAVVTDLAGKVHGRKRVDTVSQPRPEQVMGLLCQVVEADLREHKGKRPSGVGVGISGLVDREKGLSVRFPRAENWDSVPVAEILSERFGLPVFVENDVQAATLAHLRFGAGRGVKHFLYLHIGHGIRLGMVADGKLYGGATGKAGELGHVVVAPEGPVCYCGNFGCLESVAGPAAIVGQAREAVLKGVESSVMSLAGGDVEKVSFRVVLEAAGNGDALAVNLLEKAGQHIGQALANLANVLEPELVIAGGIETKLLKPLVEVITGKFRLAAMPGIRDRVRVEMSGFDMFPCALGAGILGLERVFAGE